MTAKIDLFKLHKDDYVAKQKPTLVDVSKAKYLAITGSGGPGGDEFDAKLGGLYGMAYTIKMTRKFNGEQDYVVCKLEGEYWSDEPVIPGQPLPRDLHWQLMIRTPDFVEPAELEKAVAALLEKGKEPECQEVELITLKPGRCVQMLHLGPYEQEHETLEVMAAFADAEGLEFHGRHHEIYLSDPRRVPPERLKTILRQPVRKLRS